MGDALTEVDTATDFRSGTLRPTGAPLDLATEGDGFFVLDTPNGERFTRGGSLRLDVEGKEIARLRMESVPAGTVMDHEAGTLFVP